MLVCVCNGNCRVAEKVLMALLWFDYGFQGNGHGCRACVLVVVVL